MTITLSKQVQLISLSLSLVIPHSLSGVRSSPTSFFDNHVEAFSNSRINDKASTHVLKQYFHIMTNSCFLIIRLSFDLSALQSFSTPLTNTRSINPCHFDYFILTLTCFDPYHCCFTSNHFGSSMAYQK